MKKLRQGQTVYFVDMGHQFNPQKPSIIKWFLHSQKQELPPECVIITKLPVDYANDRVKEGWFKLYTSRRKAITELNNTKRKVSCLNI